MLLITWGAPVRGREERALEVFNESMGLMGRMQQDGRIESLDVGILRPNGTTGGYIVLRGSAAQIDGLYEDPEFLANTADAQMIVEDFRHTPGYCGEGVARMMETFATAVAKVPQFT